MDTTDTDFLPPSSDSPSPAAPATTPPTSTHDPGQPATEGTPQLDIPAIEAKAREGYVKIPGENATDDERNAFFAAQGRPETPAEYQTALPEGVDIDQDRLAAMAPIAHQHGASQSLWNALINADAAYQKQVQTQHAAEWTEECKTSRSAVLADWEKRGVSESEVDAYARQAQAAIKSERFASFAKAIDIGGHGALLDIMASIGKMMADNKFVPGQSAAPQNLSRAQRLFSGTPFTQQE